MVSIYQSIARDSRDYQYKKLQDKKLKESEAIRKKKALKESTNVNISPDGSVNVNVDNTPVAPVPEVIEPEVSEEITNEEVIEEGCSKDKEVEECDKSKTTEESDDKKTITESEEEIGKDVIDTIVAKISAEDEELANKVKDILSKEDSEDEEPEEEEIEEVTDEEVTDEEVIEEKEGDTVPIHNEVDLDEVIAMFRQMVKDNPKNEKAIEFLKKYDKDYGKDNSEEEPLEECEITSYKITRIAPKSKVYMLEAQTKEGLRYITGKNFDETSKILDEAEVSLDKAKASDRFRKLMKGE